MKLAIADLSELVGRCLRRGGMAPASARLVAETIVAAERDGARSHGLQRLPGYLSSLASGWVDGRARPVVVKRAPGMIHVDARNGFAQVALARAAPLLRRTARRTGVAVLGIHHSHHFASLWPDVEPFAADGFVAITMVNSRRRLVAWGGRETVLGTNAMAFACPRRGALPLVWDQASSAMAQGEVLVRASAGAALPAGVGVDRDGMPTTDAAAVLEGGAFLPFAGPKGSAIAFMVEVLAAALTGGRFGFEDSSVGRPGAVTSNAGQFVLLIDPGAMAPPGFADRIEALIQRLRDAGAERLPADARYARRRRAATEGIEVPDDMHAYLVQQAGRRRTLAS
jgi:delta1-piperideine-2-carboxylate reductase